MNKQQSSFDDAPLFPLGRVLMTPGVAALEIDIRPYLVRHVVGDWGDLAAFDRQQNDQALKEGTRLLSAYKVAQPDGTSSRIWIISEADRSATTILLPAEY